MLFSPTPRGKWTWRIGQSFCKCSFFRLYLNHTESQILSWCQLLLTSVEWSWFTQVEAVKCQHLDEAETQLQLLLQKPPVWDWFKSSEPSWVLEPSALWFSSFFRLWRVMKEPLLRSKLALISAGFCKSGVCHSVVITALAGLLWKTAKPFYLLLHQHHLLSRHSNYEKQGAYSVMCR